VPRFVSIQTNFTSGELSPRLKARVDLARYYNGVSLLEGFVPMAHGGARRRGGIRWVGAVADSARLHRLISFVFNRDDAYVLELGHLTMRVYRDGAIVGAPFVLTTPFTEADLDELNKAQLYDTAFLAHPSYSMRQLQRFDHADWKITAAPIVVPPIAEQGEKPNTTLTLAAVTGAGINFTAGAASFLAGNVGQHITKGKGRALITGFTSPTVVVCTIIDDFDAVGPHAAGDWTLAESPQATLTPSGTLTLGGAATLTLSANGWKNDAQVSHIGMFVIVNDGMVEITGYTSALVATGIVRSEITATAAPANSWTLEQSVWNATNGFPRALTIFEQRLYAAGSVQYPQTVWGTKTGDFYNYALGVGDGDGVSFTIAADDASPIEHLSSATDLLPLTSSGEFRMTGGTDTAITPTNVRIKPMSFYGANFVRPVRVGNEVIFVSRSGKRVRALSDRLTSDASSGLSAPDLTILAEHITGELGLVDLAFQKDPDPLLWGVRADGLLIACAYDREQEVVGWAREPVQATLIESCCVIPYGAEDQTWVEGLVTTPAGAVRWVGYLDDTLNTDWAVEGAVGSSALVTAAWAAGVLTVEQTGHGYSTGDRVKLEQFDPPAYNIARTITVTGPNHYEMELTADPGALVTVGVARLGVATWAGLTHLNGMALDVVADGAHLAPVTPAAGSVTIERPAFDVEFGLHYDSKVTLLPVEERALGTAAGREVSVYEVVVRVHNTVGLRIDGQEVAFGPIVHNQAPPPFSGDKKIERTVWEKSGGAVEILQPYPRPSQILGVVRKVAIND